MHTRHTQSLAHRHKHMCIHLHTLARIPVLTTHVHTYSHVTPPPPLHTHIHICGPPYLTYALTRTHMLTNTGMYTQHVHALTCAHMYMVHMCTHLKCVYKERCVHTCTPPLGLQMSRKILLLGGLSSRMGTALQGWGLHGLPRLTLCWLFSLFSFFGFFVVPSVPET